MRRPGKIASAELLKKKQEERARSSKRNKAKKATLAKAMKLAEGTGDYAKTRRNTKKITRRS